MFLSVRWCFIEYFKLHVFLPYFYIWIVNLYLFRVMLVYSDILSFDIHLLICFLICVHILESCQWYNADTFFYAHVCSLMFYWVVHTPRLSSIVLHLYCYSVFIQSNCSVQWYIFVIYFLLMHCVYVLIYWLL